MGRCNVQHNSLIFIDSNDLHQLFQHLEASLDPTEDAKPIKLAGLGGSVTTNEH
jgi:hypothetical protein